MRGPAARAGRGVLLASTVWWPFTARIAMRFADAGWRVEAICPAGHPMRMTAAVARAHQYSPLRPAAGWLAAIAAADPDLIVPCDDRAVTHLHDLHRDLHATPGLAATKLARLIARSLGRPDAFPIVERRAEVSRICLEEELPAPPARQIDTQAALQAALDEFGLPMMLKSDGSWGGLGTMAVRTKAEAERAWRVLAQGPGVTRMLKHLIVDRDPFQLLPWLTREPRRVSAQRFVDGQPANSVVACWEGEVLAGIQVEVLSGHPGHGASTVARLIEHPDMTRAAERLTRRLGLSGFYGFDFMIERATGRAHLIELNPRATQLCHLNLGPGLDPVAALLARLQGSAAAPAVPRVTDKTVIAYFPEAWRLAPDSPLLSSAYHDVPWADPDLVRELVRPPYHERGLLARLLARRRRGVGTVRRRSRLGTAAPPFGLGAPSNLHLGGATALPSRTQEACYDG